MCKEIDELYNELELIELTKHPYSKGEYLKNLKSLKRKWVNTMLTHKCDNNNNDKINFTISLN
jgi:hypothetical protein